MGLALMGFHRVQGQSLKPGFDPAEYVRLLEISNRQIDTPWGPHEQKMLPEPVGCKLVYRSAVTGLDNRWDLWMEGDSVGIISIRGSIGREESWIENFYCGMVPATGILQLNDSTTFKYKLAEDFKACVHVGWLIGMASMAPEVVAKVREYRHKGIRRFIIMGHSQGGSIAFLLRSYLQYALDEKDLVFKTYCSAASKPGNQYYAYDFDYITRGGWGLRVVNTRDWVPEAPFSIQTLRDMNVPNPFAKESVFSKIYLGNDYKELDDASSNAETTYREDLGHHVYVKIKKFLPQLVEPRYEPTTAFLPAGETVVLPPYPGYDKTYVGSALAVMVHHGLRAYYDLVQHDYGNAQ